ncbi:outer membrane protein [Phreatobacter stygius]|uniref:outer membrane protein n=1 Tax=Phreatobacter stygius TaxID=1940610 RepID=UPI001FECE3E1|nr:outer membrane beta-barrel protein [Phreatobacter stygius]
MTIRSTTFLIAAGLSVLVPVAAAADPHGGRHGFGDRAPAFDWSSSYVGLHGGMALSGTPNPFSRRNGFAGGLQLGLLRQFGPAVLGTELEGSYLGRAEHGVPHGALQQTWRIAAKLRGGLSFDRTLVYGTFGYAMTRFNAVGDLTPRGSWQGGILWGGGIEQAFAGGLSARIEYNYVASRNVKSLSPAGISHSDLAGHIVKAGINYRF